MEKRVNSNKNSHACCLIVLRGADNQMQYLLKSIPYLSFTTYTSVILVIPGVFLQFL